MKYRVVTNRGKRYFGTKAQARSFYNKQKGSATMQRKKLKGYGYTTVLKKKGKR